MPWSKIGGPAHSLAIIANRLAALTPDKQAVYMRDPSSGQWQQIGGPAASLVGGAWDLYATSPGSGDLWRYDGSTWTKVGGPGAQFVGICNSVYALTPDRSQLYRFDRYSGAWTQIGGPADAIIRGGSKVYASAPSKSPILWCEALTQTSCVPPLIFDSVVRKTFPLVLQFFLLLATIHRAGNDQNEAPDCEFLPVTEMTKKLVRCLGDVLWRDIGEPFALRHTLA